MSVIITLDAASAPAFSGLSAAEFVPLEERHMAAQSDAPPACTSEVTAFVRSYYTALERGEPLAGFYANDEDAGTLGPVVKIGSGKDEEFTGYAAVERAVNEVTAGFQRNRLESRSLAVCCRGDLAWFSDLVWWSGEQPAPSAPEGGSGAHRPFASLTRWTGVCLRTTNGWKFLQLHVSEGV